MFQLIRLLFPKVTLHICPTDGASGRVTLGRSLIGCETNQWSGCKVTWGRPLIGCGYGMPQPMSGLPQVALYSLILCKKTGRDAFKQFQWQIQDLLDGGANSKGGAANCHLVNYFLKASAPGAWIRQWIRSRCLTFCYSAAKLLPRKMAIKEKVAMLGKAIAFYVCLVSRWSKWDLICTAA